MDDGELLLSFGDDTIAAINHLEISRLVGNATKKESISLKNTIVNLSVRHSLDTPQATPPSTVATSQKEFNKSSNENVSHLCLEEKCDLSLWGLPLPVLKQYEACGIKKMFSWQVECLTNPDILGGRNLVYSAPTSAGKTLVAEMLVMKTVLEKKKKALIILPFVSVVREKMFYFKNLLESSGVRIEGLMGSHALRGGIKNVDIAVCTIEKANGLINRLMEEDSLHLIGIIVVDELHLLGDPFRGYLLELLITKIKYMSTMNEDVNIQLIGMSATLPNLELLATWLDAHLYKTDFRPIPLNEYLMVGTNIYDKTLQIKRVVESTFNIQDDADYVIHLCLETVFDGHSCLIFCPTKNWCEKLSMTIAKEFYKIGNCNLDIGLKLREQLKSEAIAEALEQLKACPVGLDSSLGKSIAFGVAFHHAGLTIDERDIIEALFRHGVVRVLVATSTLSSGVNLPARRVLIRTPTFYRQRLDVQVYKQMVGRAGRMGKDTEGESFLICSQSEKNIGENIIQDDLKPIASCLGHGELSSSLKRAILEVIASGVAETPEKVQCYTKCTLLAASQTDLEDPIESCIAFLVKNEFIRLQLTESNMEKYVPTPLGNACLAASMSPDDGLELFQELQKARQCFVLENELHLVYLVTPFSVSAQWRNLDWLQIMSFWEKLSPSMKTVGKLVGIDEAFMIRALRGTINLRNHKQVHKLTIHRRFYTALALQELVNETPLIKVAEKFQCSKGMLQSLQQTSATFAGMVTAFCKRLGWKNLELLISQFQDRLQFGVHRELCELMQLDLLNSPRARALFNAGILSLGDLASADVCEVENALHKCVSFQTSKEMDGETKYDAAYRNQLKTIWITGKEGLTEREAAELLIKEARVWLQREFGLVDVKWANDNNESSVIGEDNPGLKEPITTCNYNDSEYSVKENLKNHDSKMENIVEPICSFVSQRDDAENPNSTPKIFHEDTLETIKNSTLCNSENCKSSQDSSEKVLHDNKQSNCSYVIGTKLISKINDTVKETPDFSCESICDTVVNERNITEKINIHPESPMNDIFYESQNEANVFYTDNSCGKYTCDFKNKESITDENKTFQMKLTANGSSEIFNLECLEGNKTDAKMIHENKTVSCMETEFLFNHEKKVSPKNGDSRVCASRYSLDLFDSPISIFCKSPTIFEESLVINSHLENLLDDSNIGDKKSPDICKWGNENTYNIHTVAECNIVLSHTEKEGVKEKSLVNNKHSTFHLESKQNIALDTATNSVKEENSSEKSKELQHDLFLKENNQEILIANGERKVNIEKGGELGVKGVDLSDSFLKQAFATTCDFSYNRRIEDFEKNVIPFQSNAEINLISKCNKFSIKGKEVGCLASEEGTKVTSNVKTFTKFINPTIAKKSNVFSNRAGVEYKGVNSEYSRRASEKLSFVSDSGEDDDDLVPSSQSQSDNLPTSFSNVRWGKNEKIKKDTLKRKRLEEKEDCKLQRKEIAKSFMETESNSSWDCFQVVDVCSDRRLFEEFKKKCESHFHVAFSIACEKGYNETPKESIGDKILGKKPRKILNLKKLIVNGNCCVTGISVCLGGKNAYFISLDPTSKADGSQTVTFAEQLELVESLMTRESKSFASAFDIKEQYKILYRSCSINIDKEVCDPKVAEWILDSESDEKSLRSLMTKYLPSSTSLLKRVGNIAGLHSLGLNFKSSFRARIRASVEAVVTWHLINVQLKRLEEYKVLNVFKEIEMPTILCLARMEINGIGYCRDETEKLYSELQIHLRNLEQDAFKLAQRAFSLSSTNEVAKILFNELRLKVWKYTSAHKPSTSKEVLIKLKNDHPLPSVILEWRKVHMIVTKIILPFLKMGMSERLYGSYVTHTATGRISMHEPNLQSVPRDFDISLPEEEENITISLRVAFIPKSGNTFISADYSQLELRLLAHLSQDKVLIDILKCGTDVFKSVAATWKQIPEMEVTDNLRQKAKQVCYGVIYGIGANALADQLEVDEEEAASFMQDFLNTYSGLKKYRQDVIQKCREKGFVETFSGRKRFLPLINSNKPHLRAQAERQAVNTTIQGSAADIAKIGMVLVEASLKAVFRNESPRVRRLRENKRQCIGTSTATLVLHLHDELLYEVCDEYIDEAIHIIKGGMEGAANLSVPLPVRIKCGKSWGVLKEIY